MSVLTYPVLRLGFRLAFRFAGECYPLTKGRFYQRMTGCEDPYHRRFAVGSPCSLTSSIKNVFPFIGVPFHSPTGFRVLVFEKSHSNYLPTVTRFALTLSLKGREACQLQSRGCCVETQFRQRAASGSCFRSSPLTNWGLSFMGGGILPPIKKSYRLKEQRNEISRW